MKRGRGDTHGRTRKRPYGGRRGAVALEYILLAAFMAIGLMGAFAYFHRTLSVGVEEMTGASAFATSNSVKEAMDKLGR